MGKTLAYKNFSSERGDRQPNPSFHTNPDVNTNFFGLGIFP
jgi:hypothetical protein